MCQQKKYFRGGVIVNYPERESYDLIMPKMINE